MQYEESEEQPSISLSASRPVGHPRPWQPVQDIPPARPDGLFLVSLREVGSKARRWLRVREPEGWANARGEPGSRESRARTCLRHTTRIFGLAAATESNERAARRVECHPGARAPSWIILALARGKFRTTRQSRASCVEKRVERNRTRCVLFDSQPAEACARTTVLAHPLTKLSIGLIALCGFVR